MTNLKSILIKIFSNGRGQNYAVKIPYKNILGSVIYTIFYTHSDITFG